jgi:hypothetical protein
MGNEGPVRARYYTNWVQSSAKFSWGACASGLDGIRNGRFEIMAGLNFRRSVDGVFSALSGYI